MSAETGTRRGWLLASRTGVSKTGFTCCAEAARAKKGIRQINRGDMAAILTRGRPAIKGGNRDVTGSEAFSGIEAFPGTQR